MTESVRNNSKMDQYSITQADLQRLYETSHKDLEEQIWELEAEVDAYLAHYETNVPSAQDSASVNYMTEWLRIYKKEMERRLQDEEAWREKEIKDMTGKELQMALYDLDDERRYFSRSLRGQVWSETDTETYENMNRAAQAIVDEQQRRRKTV